MAAERPDVMPKVRDLPHKPGVYLFKDRFNRVIYVGKARDLDKRVSQYFHPSRSARADRKTQALLDSIWDLETHTVKSEPESLLLEGKLIKEYRPRYNISFRDDKRFLLVKVQPQRSVPALHAHAREEGRRRALLRPVRPFRLAAQDARPAAQEIPPPHLPARTSPARSITAIASSTSSRTAPRRA